MKRKSISYSTRKLYNSYKLSKLLVLEQFFLILKIFDFLQEKSELKHMGADPIFVGVWPYFLT